MFAPKRGGIYTLNMSVNSRGLVETLNQQISCRILRAMLSSAVPIPLADLASRLRVEDESLMSVVAALARFKIIELSGDGYGVSAAGRASHELWAAIQSYEAQLLKERAKRNQFDVVTRFQISDALREGIELAKGHYQKLRGSR
jgi:hypothetical protein